MSNAKVNRPTFIIKTQPPSPTNDSEVPVVRTLKTWPSDNFIDSNNHNGLFVNKPQQLPCIDQTTLHYSSSMTVGDTVSIQPPAISQHCKICNEGFVNDTSAFQMHLRGHMKDCKIIARKCGVIRMWWMLEKNINSRMWFFYSFYYLARYYNNYWIFKSKYYYCCFSMLWIIFIVNRVSQKMMILCHEVWEYSIWFYKS